MKPGAASWNDALFGERVAVRVTGNYKPVLPNFLMSGFRVAPIPFIGDWLDAALPKFITEGMNVQFFFGGTSLLIVVGVAMDTVQQVESQLIMRHYDGFMKKSRIRGRRA